MDEKVPLYCVLTCDQKCINTIYSFGLLLSLIFTGITTIVSLYNVILHYSNFNMPYFQSKIIIILLLPPLLSVFAVSSFSNAQSWIYLYLATYFEAASIFLQIIAVLSFLNLIFAYLGYQHQDDCIDERKVYEIMRSKSSEIPQGFPLSYFQKSYQISNWRKAKYFSNRCKKMLFLYLIAKIVAVFIFFSFKTAQNWEYDIPDYLNTAVYWITTILSYLAYYYVNLLFNCFKNPLKSYNPDLKFSVIIFTVFILYWQTTVFVIFQEKILRCFDRSSPAFLPKKIMFGLQHMLISLQMMIYSFVCVQAFGYEPFLSHNRKYGSITYIIKSIITLFFAELHLIKPQVVGKLNIKYDEDETELRTITNSLMRNNNKAPSTYQFKINKKIEDVSRQDYF